MKSIPVRLFYAVLLACALSACSAPKKVVQGGPFLQLSNIESALKKGVSTKMDVQHLLGTPQGMGGALLPVTAIGEQEIWFYQNIEIGNFKSQQNYITMDADQKVLLVFFSKELFDGFLWFKNDIKGTSR